MKKSRYLLPQTTLVLVASAAPAFAQTINSMWMTDLIGPAFVLAVWTIVAIIYFSPTIIAFRKNHQNKWLYLLLNTVLGITVIGWVALLILVHLDIYISADGKIINNTRAN